MKMDRKTKADPVSDKLKAVKKERATAVKRTLKTNGRHLPMPFEHAPIGIVESSLDGRYLNVNEEFCRILGYEKEELLQGSIRDFTFEEDYPLDIKLHEQLITGEIPFYRFEKRYLRKDGEIIWTELTRSLVRDAKGKALYIVSTVLDINDRKKAEAQVKWQAHLLAELADAVLVTDENFVFTSWNKAAERIYGWKAEEVVGKNAQDILQTEFLTGTREAAREKVYQAGSFSGEVIQQRKDGTKIIIEGKVIALRDEDGKIIGYVSVNRDVTERKQAEIATQESQQRYAATYQYAPIGIVECSLDGKYLNVNEEFCRFLGYRKEELIGHGFKGITYEDDYAIDIRLHQKLVAGEIPFYRLEKRYIRKDGSVIWAEITRTLVCDAQDRPLYSIGTVLDMSERKHVESVLRDSVERLRIATSAARMFMWEWDLQKQTYTADENFEKAIGFSAGLLPQGNVEAVQNLMPLQDRQGLTAAVIKALENHSDRFSRQVRLINPESKSGETVWLDLSAKIVYDKEGNALRMFGVSQNITERKKAQEEIAIISRMPAENPNPVMRITPDGDLLYANNASQRLLNLSQQADQTVPVELKEWAAEAFGSGLKREIEIEQNGNTFSFTLAPIHEAGYVNLYGKDVTERRRAEEALRSRTRQQQAIASLGELAVGTTDLQSLFNRAAIMVTETLGIQYCKVLELLENKESLLLRAGIGWKPGLVGHTPVSAGLGSQAGYTLLSNTPVIVADLREEQRFSGPPLLVEHNVVSGMSCIIHGAGGKPWGVLGAHDTRHMTFTEDDVNFLVSMANILGEAIQRHQAEQALTEYARHQEALYKLADRLHRTSDLKNVFDSALDAILGALQCDRASILLYDEAKVMRFVAWRGLSDAYRQATDGHSPWTPDTVNPEPICMNDIETADLSDSLRATIREEGIGALSFIPLVSNGKLIGKFMVYFNQPHVFGEGEVDLSLTIAYQIAFGIERRRAEEQLRLKEAELEAVINQTPFMLTRCTRDLRYRFVSRAYAEMIGRAPEEVEGKPIVEIMGKEGFATISPYVERVLQGEPVEYESHVSFQGVGAPYLHVAYVPDYDEQGNVVGWFASIVDITARKIAEEALRLENERFMHFANSNIVGILIGDTNGKVTFSNDYYLNLLGVSRQDFDEGKVDWRKFTPPEWLPADEKAIQELKERGVCEPYEKEYVRTDGTRIPVYITNAILPGSGQEIAAFVLDITARKRAEEALRQNEKMLSTMIEAAPFGVYFIDSEFRLQAINKGSEAVFSGIHPLLGRDFAEILRLVWTEPFATEAIERFRHTLATGESFISPPTIEERANINEIQAYDWQIHRITLSDGTLGVVCYFYDLSEQKRMEATVRASETLYRTIARSIPGGGVYVVDKDFRYLVAEGPVTDAFGLSRGMLEGRTVTEAFPDERGARMEERLRKTFAGETVSFETKFNGRVYWTQQAPLYDALGHAIILTIDITERKQAEEALRESEERFRAILRQATAGIVRKDKEGRLIFVNQAFCNMLDYTEEELLGKTMWELMAEEDRGENQKMYRRMMVEGVPFKLERRLIRRDGSVIWVDASVSPIMDAEGKPQSAVTVEVDITARKQAEAALQQLNLQLEERVLNRTAKLRAVNQTLRDEIAERKRVEEALRASEAIARANETKLQTLFELLPIGVSFLDPEGQIIQTNSALANILKLSKEQLLDQEHRSRRIIRANGTPMPSTEFASNRALAENRTIYNTETGIVLENGEVVWTSVSAAPVDVPDVGAVVATVDISDSKRAEQALRESHERLRILSQRLVEVQEEERRAIARELHDRVGQTLAALNINLIIINSQLTNEVAQQIGTRLNDSMKLVAETIALVRDVMTDLRPAVLDDYGLEAALEAHLAQFISRYDINAKLEKPEQPIPRIGPSIEMTFLRIAQEALINIARHAQATQVDLSLRQEEDALTMTVHDNGTGIVSWQRANRPGSHGLTIMRERAEAFGGTLRVKTAPGEGTSIEVRIPFHHQAQSDGLEEKRV